jgi:hypothetical protein
VLIECGLARVVADDGVKCVEYTFRPSFGRIAALGAPHEIVELYAALHGKDAAPTAAYVLAGLCDQDDATPLIGWRDERGWNVGGMSESEQIMVARRLMRHGIIGKARPTKKGDGQYSDRFDAAEYISAARVHLGLSSADAEALTMTEFQMMMDMKFPPSGPHIHSQEEYDAALKALKERRRGN